MNDLFLDAYLIAGTDYQHAPVVVLDESNQALQHFIKHMTESLAQTLWLESERSKIDFDMRVKQIIKKHVQGINDYINANIQTMLKEKE